MGGWDFDEMHKYVTGWLEFIPSPERQISPQKDVHAKYSRHFFEEQRRIEEEQRRIAQELDRSRNPVLTAPKTTSRSFHCPVLGDNFVLHTSLDYEDVVEPMGMRFART